MRVDFPVEDPAKFVVQSEGAGDNNNTIAANARVLYPDNPEFAAAVDRLLSAESRGAATTALTDAGYEAGSILSAPQRNAAMQAVMTNLQVNEAEANYLIDRVFKRMNEGDVAAADAQVADVRAALERRNVLGTFTGQVPGYYMDTTVDFISERFGVDKATARSLIEAATSPRDDGITAADVETMSIPDAPERDTTETTDSDFSPEKFRDNTIIGQLENIFGGKDDAMDVDLTSLSTADLNAIITNNASSNAQVAAATQEIIKRSRQPEDAAAAADRDDADVDLSARTYTPDVIFRGMGRRIPYKKVGDDYYRIKDDGTLAASPADAARKSMLDNPNRRDVEQVGGVDVVSDVAVLEQAIEDDSAQKLSAVALAMKYLDGTLSRTEAQELKAILKGPNGAVFAQAVNRVKARRQAEKDVSAYTGTTIRGTCKR